ncbi:MAG: hypothetical protein ACTSQY_08745 [Candidatus Odinarchaeia archaeon]
MFKWITVLMLAMVMCFGGGATAQEVEDSNALWVVTDYNVELIVPTPQFGLFYPVDDSEDFQIKGSSMSVLATIPVVRKVFELPQELTFNVGLDLGGVVAQDSDIVGFTGVSVGNLQKPLVWAVEKIPAIGNTLGDFVDLLDGRVGYGLTFDIDGNTEHGFVVGVLSIEFEF